MSDDDQTRQRPKFDPGAYRSITPRSTPIASPPPQPKTTELPAVKVPGSQLDEILELAKTTAQKVDTISSGVVDLNTRVNLMEDRQLTLESELDIVRKRASTTSSWKRQASDVDMRHSADIAALHEKVDGLEKKTDEQTAILRENTSSTDEIKTIVTGFFQRHPAVATALVQTILAVLALIGWWAKAQMGGHP